MKDHSQKKADKEKLKATVASTNRYFYQEPHRYPRRVIPLKAAITAWLAGNDLAGDAFFCAPNVWKARGELYCFKSDMILVIDGSSLYEALNHGEYPEVQKQFWDICEKHGYHYELGEAWYLGLYYDN